MTDPKILKGIVKLLSDYEVVLMVGLPRSGKSTVARCLVDAGLWAHIICLDNIRKRQGSVWNPVLEGDVKREATDEACAWLGAKPIIVDSMNQTYTRRSHWEQLAHRNNYKVAALHIRTSVDECKRRLAMTDPRETGLTPEVIDKKAAEFEFPGEPEIDLLISLSEKLASQITEG